MCNLPWIYLCSYSYYYPDPTGIEPVPLSMVLRNTRAFTVSIMSSKDHSPTNAWQKLPVSNLIIERAHFSFIPCKLVRH